MHPTNIKKKKFYFTLSMAKHLNTEKVAMNKWHGEVQTNLFRDKKKVYFGNRNQVVS